MSSENSKIAFLTRDAHAEDAVTGMLKEQLKDSASLIACRDLASLKNCLLQNKATLAFVDIDEDPAGLLDELEPLANQFVHTRFVALTSDLAGDLVMRAMQAGIRHVQLKTTIEQEMGSVVQRLLNSAAAVPTKAGTIITVLSAGGGCGSTTLVVNLANELQLATSNPVLIVDLDYIYGAVGTYLELSGRYGIADVLQSAEKIDPELISTTAVKAENLHALLSPASVDFGAGRSLDPANLDAALAACKQGYEFTIIDAPRVPIDVAATLAESSDIAHIVFQPMVKDIRVAKDMMSALIARGIPAEKIRPIINRYRRRREMITFDEAQKVLGGMPLERLSNDYTSAVRGINFGKPLANSAPRSALRRDFVDLASRVSDLKSKRNGHTGEEE